MLTFLTHKNSSVSFTCSCLTEDVFPIPNLQSPHSHTAQPFNSASLIVPSAWDSQSQDEQNTGRHRLYSGSVIKDRYSREQKKKCFYVTAAQTFIFIRPTSTPVVVRKMLITWDTLK